jgi:tetratricopeptide (TPR) repeat protein
MLKLWKIFHQPMPSIRRWLELLFIGHHPKKDGKLAESVTNLEKAIELGKNKYEKSSGGFREAFNLAIYYHAAGQTLTAYSLYEKTISAGATEEWLKMAIQDLEELLSIFPNEKEFEKTLTMVKKRLVHSKASPDLHFIVSPFRFYACFLAHQLLYFV